MNGESSESKEPKKTRRLSWHAVFLRAFYCMTIITTYGIWAGLSKILAVQIGPFGVFLYTFVGYKLFTRWASKTIERPRHLTTWHERMSALVRVALPDALMVGWLALSTKAPPANFYQAAAAVVTIRVAIAFAIIWFFDRSRPRLFKQLANLQNFRAGTIHAGSASNFGERERKSLPEIILTACIFGGFAATMFLLVFR